ncbi:hypothetical protein [Brachybacterium alimentarium]|uniref:hypothetical protein n=1 Tax=Brachybacterium alimentarium TaxID=47845 RepID=UPI003FD431BC
MTKSTNAKSAADAATENLTAVTDAIAKAETEVAALEAEHSELTEQAESGSILADLDRLEEVTDTLERRRSRLEYLNGTVLPVAEISANAEALSRAANGIGKAGVVKAHSAWEQEQAEAEAMIREGLERLRLGAERWNGTVEPLIATARAQGVIDGKVDPLLPVRVKVTDTGYRGSHSALIVNGEGLAPVNPDALVAAAVRGADAHVAGLIAEASSARVAQEAQRVESFLGR